MFFDLFVSTIKNQMVLWLPFFDDELVRTWPFPHFFISVTAFYTFSSLDGIFKSAISTNGSII